MQRDLDTYSGPGAGLGERARLRATLWLLGGFWSFWGLALTLYWWVAGAGETIPDALRRAPVMLLGAALCLSWFAAFRLFRRRTFLFRAVVAAMLLPPISFIYAAASVTIFQGVDALRPDDAQAFAEAVRELFLKVVRWTPSFISCGAMMLALEYAFDVKEREARIRELSREADHAQLAALRFQVNPHFLFNALNSAVSLIVGGRPKVAEQLLRNLAVFLRSTLAHDPLDETSLREELDLQVAYLDIEKVRFPERLKLRYDVTEEALSARMPNLILQPLVENAIKHGVGRSSSATTIALSAAVDGDRLVVVVHNDTPAKSARAEGLGVGLENVRRRLRAIYGDAAELSAGAQAAGGFSVRIALPYSSADRDRRRRPWGTPSAAATEAT